MKTLTETYQTSVTSKGQITLPAKFRKQMNIASGRKVTLTLKGDQLTITAPQDVDALRLETATHLARHKFRPLTDEELDDAINQASQDAAIERSLRSYED